MDYLVTMTTHVPDGVTEVEVAAVREREAAHTADLARAGQVLRLWRPPLRPDEWRTLGLFAADDDRQLEQVLAGMPLRIWRTDAVTPLGLHPNDPGPGRVPLDPRRTEFLTTLVLDDLPAARELAADGSLLRLWTLPEPGRTLGHWQAADGEQLAGILRSLLTSGDTIPLTAHPSDPGRQL